MSEERSRYNTDPLDPDFARQTEEIRESGAATREVGRSSNETARRDAGAESPTLKFTETPPAPSAPSPAQTHQSYNSQQPFASPASYPSVFVPPLPPAPPAIASWNAPNTQTPPAVSPSVVSPPTGRKLPGINLPENIALILPYIPFLIGGILAAVELFLIPRSEKRARFHAAQGLALHAVVLIAGFVFRMAGNLADVTMGGFASFMIGMMSFFFWLATTIFMIVCLIRVWQGNEQRLSVLSDLTKWLEDQIEPRK